MSTVGRRILGLTTVALVIAGTSYAAVAATSGSSPTYYACVKTGNILALTTKTKACPGHERKISFNAKGVRGATGPRGAPGAGTSLVDAKGHVLGSVISADRTQVQIVTSKGFQVTLAWATGKFVQAEADKVYNAASDCSSSTSYLLDPNSDPNPGTNPKDEISGTALLYTTLNNQLLKPVATTTAKTAITSIVTPKAIVNLGACGQLSGVKFAVWDLTPITRSAAGLPATITTPLTFR